MNAKLTTLIGMLLLLAGTVYYNQHQLPQNEEMQTETAQKKLEAFPDVAFATPEGKTFHIGDIKEPTVLVHFWAAWCLPCHAELPQLVKYVKASHGKIALLSVSLDDDYEESWKLLDKADAYGPHFYFAWDKNKALSLHSFGTVKVPETIAVNTQRMMEDKIIGPGPWGEASGH